jgi:hypothetical protein
MPTLSPTAWLVVGLILLALLALVGLTVWGVLRPPMRARVAALPVWGAAVVAGLAVAPWLVVKFAPLSINVNIHGIGPLLLWILAAIGIFALLVLLPVGGLVAVGVWVAARRRLRQVRPSS